jgi:CubicO group peptidase (beta-lactamase class C family)
MKICSALCLLILALLAPSTIVEGADAKATLQSVLQSFVDKHIASGVVALVANKEGVLALETAGYANLADKSSLREDAVFWIASMSKSLTGVALMMLVDEGKLSLDDPVEKYLPEFKGQLVAASDGSEPPHPPKHPITVREIMCHTSGMVLANDKGLKQTQNLKDDVAEYATRPLRQEPGTKYEYNNCGINTGGRLIEVVSGLAYADFMQTRLFTPLGMRDTTCWPNDEQAARLAHSSRLTEDKLGLVDVNLDANVSPKIIEKLSAGTHVPQPVVAEMGFGISNDYGKHYAMPAGGYFSTAHDLSQFCRMLLRGGELDGKRYLSEKALNTLSASQLGEVKLSPKESYGVGFSLKLSDEEGPSAGSFGHRGARRTAFWIDPKNKLAMVILVERLDMSGEQQKVLYGDFMKTAVAKYGNPPPAPTFSDISFGPHPHQLIDIYLPKKGDGPFPAILWFGGIWKAAKHPANLGFFDSKGVAVIAVETRTMEDAAADKEKEPISYVQTDAIRAVQFVRHNAAKWNLDPARIATGGGSQGAQPALFVGCSRDYANSASQDPVERESSLVTCVAAYRCQPTLDPVRMQEWVPGVKWGAPALGCSFEESLKRRDELLPIIHKWSPDYLLHKDAAPMFFENEWGLTLPKDITQANYDVHCPNWALGFQSLAIRAGATCFVNFPEHPVREYSDIWNFVAQKLLNRPAQSSRLEEKRN